MDLASLPRRRRRRAAHLDRLPKQNINVINKRYTS
jgi:hypothetical protein